MKKRIIEDLIGKRFNRLVVLNLAYINNHSKVYWECICDCGKLVVVRGDGLKCGDNQSCGCYQKELASKMFKKPDGVAAFNKLFYEYKSNAFRKGRIFDLTEIEFKEITSKNCFYCGSSPISISKSKKDRYIYNGIDRINSSKGYELKNVVTCCPTCNIAKHIMSKEDFLSWIERVYNHSIRKGEINT